MKENEQLEAAQQPEPSSSELLVKFDRLIYVIKSDSWDNGQNRSNGADARRAEKEAKELFRRVLSA